MKDKVIEAGIVSQERVDAWINAFNQWTEDEGRFFSNVLHNKPMCWLGGKVINKFLY